MVKNIMRWMPLRLFARVIKSSYRLALFAIMVAILVSPLALAAWYGVLYSRTTRAEVTRYHPLLGSRQSLEGIENVIRELKPTPPMAARIYAYDATAYDMALQAGVERPELYANYVVGLLLPKAYGYGYKAITVDMLPSVNVIQPLIDRIALDRSDLVWNGKIPSGEGKWIKNNDMEPFEPRAGDWTRWIVDGDFKVPAPPAVGSDEEMVQLQIVKQASLNRTGNEVNKINFWGGTPGTNSPSGIWQDQLYAVVRDKLPLDEREADLVYSNMQAVLAQTIADAFIECWKVKYTYWTARPDMRDSTIKTAMPDPVFPGYVSGHSTISKAAADVLSVMIPTYAQQWEDWAAEARDSRLNAGVHFKIDNDEGFKLGESVAKMVITKKQLHQLL